MGEFHAKRKDGQKFIVKHKKSYKNVATMQANGYEEVFKDFLNKEFFDLIIELGTRSGGLTLFLADNSNVPVHSFEKFKNFLTKPVIKKLETKGVVLHFADALNSNAVPNLVKKTTGRILLLCDNGDKVREVSQFAPVLKSNDVIMGHDYFATLDDYHNQNFWKSCEIMDEHIDYNIVEKYYPYYDKFKDVVWVCTRRI
jgi:hypothetical protein